MWSELRVPVAPTKSEGHDRENGDRRTGGLRIAGHLPLRHCGSGSGVYCGFGFDYGFGDYRSLLRNQIAVLGSKNRTCILFRFGFARERNRNIDGILRTLKILRQSEHNWLG